MEPSIIEYPLAQLVANGIRGKGQHFTVFLVIVPYPSCVRCSSRIAATVILSTIRFLNSIEDQLPITDDKRSIDCSSSVNPSSYPSPILA